MPDTCAYNDFALVQVDAADSRRSTRASRSGADRSGSTRTAPPSATRSTPTATPACAPASRSSRPSRAPASAPTAVAGPPVYTVTPGIPGDSGSAFLDSAGAGARHPVDGPAGPGRGFQRRRRREPELATPGTYGGFAGLALALGTEPFSPSPERRLGGAHCELPVPGSAGGRVVCVGGRSLDNDREHAREDWVEDVLAVVESIPPGRVTTYGTIAEALGGTAPAGSAT